MHRFYVLVLLWCFASVGMFSCHEPALFANTEKQGIEDSVRRVLNNYYSDIRQHGLMAEFNYLDSSEDFFWVPPGYTSALSFDSVAVILKKTAPSLLSIENNFDTLHVVPLSHQLASYTARISSTARDTAGHISSSTLMETGILIKRKDGWKLLNGQTSVLQ